MSNLVIHGGNRLSGEVEVSGSKNAVLPMLAASLLAEDPCHFRRVPMLADVKTMFEMLEHLGAVVSVDGNSVTVDATNVHTTSAPFEIVRKMRATIYVLGPLLARYQHASVSFPGGCAIGNRPIDLHLRAFQELGAEIEIDGGYIEAVAKKGLCSDTEFSVDGPQGSSVGATCNILMAAALVPGSTILHGIAKEPEVQSLITMLVSMGAEFSYTGTNTVQIIGAAKLSGGAFEVPPDRIETGTFMVAAAMTKGDVLIRNCRPDDLRVPIEALQSMGATIDEMSSAIRVSCEKPLKAVSLRTLPYPGFPTDLQPQFVAALATADGESTLTETIYPERFVHVGELCSMGANITVAHATAVIKGVKRLSGANVVASDLRASAGLALAGLSAEGETTCHDMHHLLRGYENFDLKLKLLGASVVTTDGHS